MTEHSEDPRFEDHDSILRFFCTIRNTKELPRQGLILAGYAQHEVDSVASHSYVVAVLSYVIALRMKRDLGYSFIDPDAALRMALFHDMAESLTGDVGRYVKLRAHNAWKKVESLAIKELSQAADAADGPKDRKLGHIVAAFNRRNDATAWIVKVADTLDAAFQSNARNRARVAAGTGYPGKAGFSRYDQRILEQLEEAETVAKDKKKEQYAAFLAQLRKFFEYSCRMIAEDLVAPLTL